MDDEVFEELINWEIEDGDLVCYVIWLLRLRTELEKDDFDKPQKRTRF